MRNGRGLEDTLGRIPIERVDLLERLKIFGDVHRMTKFTLDPLIVATVDVTPFQEQVPTFYASQFIAAGAAGQFSALTLSNGALSKTLGRPKVVQFDGAGIGSVMIALRPNPYLGGAPSAAFSGFTDSRRGLATAPGTSVLTLRGSADAANVAPAAFYEIVAGGGSILVPNELLDDWIVMPGVDLVFRATTAVQALRVSIQWSEEPIAQPTRTG